jgi:hypothetical protein
MSRRPPARTAVYTPDERDELIGGVQAGELMPGEAEAEAQRRGLKTLRDDPDPNDFDPMNEPNWTLPMAVAWIAYRTKEAVREWWDEYRTKCWKWSELGPRNRGDNPARAGYCLEPRERANLDRLHFEELAGDFFEDEENDESPEMSISDAIRDLMITLEIPSLPATGVNASTGLRETIPAELWQDLDFTVVNKRDIVQTVNEEGRGYARYGHVTVARDAMWQPAFAVLIDHIASGDVALTGVPGKQGGVPHNNRRGNSHRMPDRLSVSGRNVRSHS